MNQFVDDFTISEIQYYNHYYLDKNYIFEGHRHDSWEINIVLKGNLEITYDDVIFTLEERQAFIGEPNSFHRNKVVGSEPVELIVIHFLSIDLPILFTPRAFVLNDGHISLLLFGVSDFEKFMDVRQLSPEYITVVPYSFKKILEVFISQITEENIRLTYLDKKDSVIYNKAVTYMKNNLDKNCSITEIATECCVCNTTLKRIFKTYTGQGVNTFFVQMKMEYSKTLLQKDYSIAAISELLGFSTQGYFSHTFKKMYGDSPLKYKKSYQDNG